MSRGLALKFGDKVPIKCINQQSVAGGKAKLLRGTAISQCGLCVNKQSFFLCFHKAILGEIFPSSICFYVLRQ